MLDFDLLKAAHVTFQTTILLLSYTLNTLIMIMPDSPKDLRIAILGAGSFSSSNPTDGYTNVCQAWAVSLAHSRWPKKASNTSTCTSTRLIWASWARGSSSRRIWPVCWIDWVYGRGLSAKLLISRRRACEVNLFFCSGMVG